MARTIRRKHLVSRGHVTLAGPAVLSGQACVGGNLTVEGDLTVDGHLLCLGRITVRGTLRAGADIVAGRGLEVQGDIHAAGIEVFSSWDEFPDMESVADAIAAYLPEPPTDEDGVEIDAVARLVDEHTLDDIAGTCHEHALLAGSVDCFVLRAQGGMRISGNLDCDIVDAVGMPLEVHSLYVDDDLTCGWLEVARDAAIGGNLYCVGLACGTLQVSGSGEVVETLLVRGPDLRPADARHAETTPFHEIGARDVARLRPGELLPALNCLELKAGSIEVRGSIYIDGALHCDGPMRVDHSVTACRGLTIGPHHGVMAGLGLSLRLWHTLGYVSTPGRRPRVLTGEFRPLGRTGRDGMRRPVGARRAK